jgi:MoaA/NifB/PqqE/SkfB family radical SAM enzyme
MNLLQAKEDLEWEFVKFRLDRRIERGLLRLPAAPGEPVPEELHLELTHRCNLKCVMCEHWEIEHDDPASVARELSLPQLRKIVEDSKRLDAIKTVVITGGEPWLRRDFVEIIAWLSGRFPDAAIVALTNFWNTGHVRLKLAELRALGVKNLKLGSSLDGLEEVHDAIRGQEGAFAGLVRTVAAVRAEFPEYSFGFTFTILPANAHQVYRAYRFITEELRSGFGAQWAVETAGIEPLGWTPERKELALSGVREVILDLCRRNAAFERVKSPEADRGDLDGLWSELLYWRWLEEYGRAPRRFDFFTRCTSGERHVMLDPEGAVFFCPVNRARTIGDASKTPLDEIWTSDKARDERDYVATGQCSCWLRCVSTPSLDRLLKNSRSS